jgi:phosphatidylglycerol lysyltransferase
LEPVYGFQSLCRFKQKFQPELQTLVMAYADPFALPAIGTALARAYLPDLSLRQAVRFMRSLGDRSAADSQARVHRSGGVPA